MKVKANHFSHKWLQEKSLAWFHQIDGQLFSFVTGEKGNSATNIVYVGSDSESSSGHTIFSLEVEDCGKIRGIVQHSSSGTAKELRETIAGAFS